MIILYTLFENLLSSFLLMKAFNTVVVERPSVFGVGGPLLTCSPTSSELIQISNMAGLAPEYDFLFKVRIEP